MSLRMIPNVFVLVEGRTEEIYINHLKTRGCNYSLHVERFEGNRPLKMVKRCAARFRERGMARRYGDLAFCVLDVDYNTADELRQAEALADSQGIGLILSNPCFEVFFLLHFMDGVVCATPAEIKAETARIIDGYTETKDCWHMLSDRRDAALGRSRAFGGIDDAEAGMTGSGIWVLFDALRALSDRAP